MPAVVVFHSKAMIYAEQQRIVSDFVENVCEKLHHQTEACTRASLPAAFYSNASIRL